MASIYPTLSIDRIKKPNRFYAFPFFGFVVKVLLIVPIAIELWFLKIAQFLFSILNACNIFFRGRYWKVAYDLNLGIMQLETNVAFFLYGLTDTYPGFSLKTTNYKITIDFNKNPNRVLATPLLGLVFRGVLMIPYSIYRQVVSLAAFIAIGVGWIWVLFEGAYPETTYEIVRDSIRIDQATTMYFLGMSDTYPSWWLSMNHKTLKILLLIAAGLLFLSGLTGRFEAQKNMRPQLQKNYHINTASQQPANPYTY